MLTGIAGTCIYVANESSAAAAHSPTTLLTSNSFDAEGNFTSIRQQGFVAGELGRLTGRMTKILSNAQLQDKESMSLIAGSAISLALTTPSSDLVNGALAPTAGLIAAQFAEKVVRTVKTPGPCKMLVAQKVSVDISACMGAASVIEEETGRIAGIITRVDGLRTDLAYSINAGLFTGTALERSCDSLRAVSRSLTGYAYFVRQVMSLYETCETKAAELIAC